MAVDEWIMMDNAWNFQSRLDGSRYENVPLWLGWTVEGAYDATAGADPGEISAEDLFRQWAGAMGDPETLKLAWSVLSNQARLLENAPYTGEDHSFLDHFTHPFRQEGQGLKWTELPILDQIWRSGLAEGPAGFIQEIAGWKPSPLQQSMDLAVLRGAWRI